MSDEFAGERLPDLPNAGYATFSERELSDAIMLFIRECERERRRLLAIVLGGKERWRKVAGDIWRGLPIDTDLLDSIYDYFVMLAADGEDQREFVRNIKNASVKRDILRRITPRLEAQLETLKSLPANAVVS